MVNFKKLMSLLMTIILIATLLPETSFVAKATKSIGLSYAFSNDLAGFAEGMITINTEEDDSGSYYLYWADDISALNGYYEISKAEVKEGVGTFEFLPNIAIPADATKLIAIKSDEEPEDKSVQNADMVYEIPKNKQNPYKSSDKTLSFEALSDTQLDLQSSVFYTYSVEHFAAALENAQAREVDFVTTSGDCINNYQNGTSKEWQAFQKIIASSSYTNPIYEANGNHSMKSDIGYGIPAFETATGLNADNSELGDTPYYEITAKNGDHFLFVALETESDVAGYDQFSKEQMDWLESKLKEYYEDNQHIFIFEHAFFHGWGPGDDKVEHYYSGGLRTTSDFPGNARFRELMDTYTEVFLYTGHSHLDFEYNWNYDNEGGKTANLFHIPATACTTHVTDGKLDYTMYEKSSQCYIVDVYDDMVITNGLNVVDNLIYPAYTYIVDTKDYTHKPVEKPDEGEEESTEESANLIDVQIENATSYLYDSGAALFFFNNDSGNIFPVNSETGIAQIPENATNLTLYRCKGSWNSGEENKSDSNTSYWNKYGPIKREIGQKIFYVAGSSKYSWKEGDIQYPEETTKEEPTEEETTGEDIEKEYTETKVYLAVPKDYSDSEYSYKFNIKCLDGSYPHSARVLEDTQTMYKGMKVYSYTFSPEYTEEYDTLGIQRIQVQCYDGKTLVYQYAIEDKEYTISELNEKIFVADSDAPTGSKLTATENSFEIYKENAEEEKEYTETKVCLAVPKDYSDSEYSYKFNIKCLDGSYPHSARVLEDTQTMYKGMKVYSYTFSPKYTEEYDTLGIQRIQVQCYDGKTLVYQYAIEDKEYTISELNEKIFVADSDAPTGSKLTATESSFEEYSEDEGDVVRITVKDTTSSGWVYSSGAVLYLYDKDTGEYYDVSDEVAAVPASAVNIVVYRCDKAWGGGNKTDDVTTYWNKWELAVREEGYDAVNLTGDGASVWTRSSDFEIDAEAKYYLVGYFDGEDYEGRDYEFNENGEVEAQFYGDSYVYVISSANTSYWTNGWLGEDVISATLYKGSSLAKADKLFVPSGKIKFKLLVNNDGTLTISYESQPVELDKSELTLIEDDTILKTEADVSSLEKLINVTKDLLRTDYRYSSYADYSKLKKMYYTYKDVKISETGSRTITGSLVSENEAQSIYNEFLGVYNDYLSMKEKNNVVTVYFCNDAGWTRVNAYIYNSETGKGINTLETAQGISGIKVLNCGVKIYCVTVNRSKWDKIIFTDGIEKKTIALDIPTENYVGFYFTDSDKEGELIPNKFLYTFDNPDEYEELAYSMHEIVNDSAISATKETDGLTEGSHCAKCHMVIQAQNIIPKIDSVSLSEEEFIFDGTDKKPDITVTDSNGNALTEGVDYTITMPDSLSEIGEYSVVIDFIGNYEGQITKTYYIRKQDEKPDEKPNEQETPSQPQETDNSSEKPNETVKQETPSSTDKSDSSETKNQSNENVKTGDSPVMIYFMMILAVISVIMLVIIRKNKILKQ